MTPRRERESTFIGRERHKEWELATSRKRKKGKE